MPFPSNVLHILKCVIYTGTEILVIFFSQFLHFFSSLLVTFLGHFFTFSHFFVVLALKAIYSGFISPRSLISMGQLGSNVISSYIFKSCIREIWRTLLFSCNAVENHQSIANMDFRHLFRARETWFSLPKHLISWQKHLISSLLKKFRQ